jgi:hypothetical protein
VVYRVKTALGQECRDSGGNARLSWFTVLKQSWGRNVAIYACKGNSLLEQSFWGLWPPFGDVTMGCGGTVNFGIITYILKGGSTRREPEDTTRGGPRGESRKTKLGASHKLALQLGCSRLLISSALLT